MSDSVNEADEVSQLKSRMWQRSFYLMTRKVVDGSKMGPVMLAHYRYIIELEKRGAIFASGPVEERDGARGAGVTVFRAASFEEAEGFADGDPFVGGGGCTYTLQRWQINEGRVSVSVDFSDMSMRAE